MSLRIQKGASCKEELRLLVAKFGLPVVAFVQQTANDGDDVGSGTNGSQRKSHFFGSLFAVAKLY